MKQLDGLSQGFSSRFFQPLQPASLAWSASDDWSASGIYSASNTVTL